MKKKDTMKMRREWVNEVLDTLDDLEEKAETNGESALMWEILKTVRENIEIQEQGVVNMNERQIILEDLEIRLENALEQRELAKKEFLEWHQEVENIMKEQSKLLNE